MKREQTLNLRVPAALKSVLTELAENTERSVADQVIAQLYQSLLTGGAWATLPSDAVWTELLRNIDALPTRDASAEEAAEFRAFKRREDAGKSEKLSTEEALALLDKAPERSAAASFSSYEQKIEEMQKKLIELQRELRRKALPASGHAKLKLKVR